MGIFDFINGMHKNRGNEVVNLSPEYYLHDAYHNDVTVKLHYKNLEKIDRLYKIANSMDDKFNEKMDQCINLCIKDIETAKLFKDLCEKCNQPLPSYSSFKRLAIIYDKRKQYREAIAVCTQAIILGYDDRGDMYSRLSKLLKKNNDLPIEEHLKNHGIQL